MLDEDANWQTGASHAAGGETRLFPPAKKKSASLATLLLPGRGSGALYVLNGVVLLLAWYATRVAAYFGFGVLLVWKHAAPLRARGLEGALTVGSWAVGGALQLQWTYRLTLGAIRLLTGKTSKKAR